MYSITTGITQTGLSGPVFAAVTSIVVFVVIAIACVVGACIVRRSKIGSARRRNRIRRSEMPIAIVITSSLDDERADVCRRVAESFVAEIFDEVLRRFEEIPVERAPRVWHVDEQIDQVVVDVEEVEVEAVLASSIRTVPILGEMDGRDSEDDEMKKYETEIERYEWEEEKWEVDDDVESEEENNLDLERGEEVHKCDFETDKAETYESRTNILEDVQDNLQEECKRTEGGEINCVRIDGEGEQSYSLNDVPPIVDVADMPPPSTVLTPLRINVQLYVDGMLHVHAFLSHGTPEPESTSCVPTVVSEVVSEVVRLFGPQCTPPQSPQFPRPPSPRRPTTEVGPFHCFGRRQIVPPGGR